VNVTVGFRVDTKYGSDLQYLAVRLSYLRFLQMEVRKWNTAFTGSIHD